MSIQVVGAVEHVVDTRGSQAAYPGQSVLTVPGAERVREATSETLRFEVWATPSPGTPAYVDWAVLLVPTTLDAPALVQVTGKGRTWTYMHLLGRMPVLHPILRKPHKSQTPREIERMVTRAWRRLSVLYDAVCDPDAWWGDPGFPERPASMFLARTQYGYTSWAEGQAWTQALGDVSVADQKATAWRERGFTPQEAAAWRAIGGGVQMMGCDEAASWATRGFTPATALPFLTAVEPVPPFLAEKWVAAGFTGQQASGYVAAGLTLPEARGHRSSGDSWVTVQTLAALRGTTVPTLPGWALAEA